MAMKFLISRQEMNSTRPQIDSWSSPGISYRWFKLTDVDSIVTFRKAPNNLKAILLEDPLVTSNKKSTFLMKTSVFGLHDRRWRPMTSAILAASVSIILITGEGRAESFVVVAPINDTDGENCGKT